ncbi:MAG: sulfotransferase [Pseudomonadota bacterium]
MRQHLTLFRQSWTLKDGRLPGLPLKRWLALALFWPIYSLIQAINAAGLALDEWLFHDYHRIHVQSPLFIAGLPRSGTTFTHRLLAGDARFTSMSLWELVFAPSISQRHFWHFWARLDRALGAPAGRLLHAMERRTLGSFDDIHHTGLTAPEEDYLALAPVSACFLLVLVCPTPSLWRLSRFDHEFSHSERRRVLNYYHRLVQRHLYWHGSDKTYLSKNPSFTPMLASLARYYPDARFVLCFRQPGEAVASQINSMLVGARLFNGRVDEAYWRRHLSDMLLHYARHSLEVAEGLPVERWQIARMEDTKAQPLATVEALYQRFGWTMTSDYRAHLEKQDAAIRGYRSRHHYSAEHLGIDTAQIERDFEPLMERAGYARNCHKTVAKAS